jgi:hypothetical protein
VKEEQPERQGSLGLLPDLQQPFGLAACEKHSLARLETAMWWLEIGEVEVLDSIADRALVAFNLAGPGAERRLPGIWSHSLLEFQPREQSGLRFSGKAHSTGDVLTDILPPGLRDLRFEEVLRALGIKRRLLHVLLEAALLAAVPGTGDKVSRAPVITRASVVEFLTARRM